MAEQYPSTAVLNARKGTLDPGTGLDFIELAATDVVGLTLHDRLTRDTDRLVKVLMPIAPLRPFIDGAMSIGVKGGDYTQGGAVKTFVEVAAQALTDDATNYVYINNANALVINTSGFPVDLTSYLPLATVTTVAGAITLLTDLRSRMAFVVPQSAASDANQALSNLSAVAINASLTPAADNVIDLGSASKAFKNAILRGDLILKNGFNYTITHDNPAAARTLSIVDPGADAAIVFDVGAQTLVSKTLTTPTISDYTSAAHNHSNAAGGGVLNQLSHGTGKYFPLAPSHHEPGALAVSVLAWKFVAPFAFTIRNVYGAVGTAPVGAAAIVDVRVDTGSGPASIFANQAEMVVIADAGFTGVSATKDHAVAAGNIVSIEIEQVGSTTPGDDLTIVLNCLAAMDTV